MAPVRRRPAVLAAVGCLAAVAVATAGAIMAQTGQPPAGRAEAATAAATEGAGLTLTIRFEGYVVGFGRE